jgi:hypothetical protein
MRPSTGPLSQRPLHRISACGQTSGNGTGTTVTSPGVDASDDGSFDSSFFDDVNTACLSFCPRTAATLNLSCASVVTSVRSTGGCLVYQCLTKDASPCAQSQLFIEPAQTGVCHVDLTLEDGFQYSVDVTFVQATPESSCCTSIVPTQATFAVDNPNSTCADAGAAIEGDAGADAGDAASE